jgi:hypothetical protein
MRALYVREAMHIAEEAGHVYTLLFTLYGLGTLKLDQGDFAGAVAPLERGVPVKKVIRAGEAFRIGSEKVRAGTYTGADTGCSGR